MKRVLRTYNSSLGEIELSINSEIYLFNVISSNKNEIITKYQHGVVSIREFELPNPIHNGQLLSGSIGWLIKISSTSNNNSSLTIKCKLNSQLKGEIESGENLEAISFLSKNYSLHIGTEDNQSIHCRSENNLEMPKRFSKTPKYSFIKYQSEGIITKFPKLEINESLKFHFLIAEAETTKDKEDVRTWLAVDKSLNEVERIIQ